MAEPTSEDLARACSAALDAADCDDLARMPFDEAVGYAYTLLYAAGVDNPEKFPKDQGILE